jgi:predicted hydrolase (HD superfamily)
MAFITKRKSGGKTYYYLVRSVRKNGIPTTEIIRSLGTAENILEVYMKHKETVEGKLETKKKP